MLSTILSKSLALIVIQSVLTLWIINFVFGKLVKRGFGGTRTGTGTQQREEGAGNDDSHNSSSLVAAHLAAHGVDDPGVIGLIELSLQLAQRNAHDVAMVKLGADAFGLTQLEPQIMQ